jgi:hypothetical protein
MKKIYIIVPLVLLVAFSFYYRNFAADLEVRKIEEAAAEQARQAAEDAEKAKAEQLARDESDKRAAERVAKEEAAAAKKKADWEAAGARIAEETAGYKKQADDFTKRVNELELQLVEIRRLKDRTTNEALALTEQIELARIAKRNAELEVQRLTDMVAERAAKSAMTQMPAPPPAASPSR